MKTVLFFSKYQYIFYQILLFFSIKIFQDYALIVRSRAATNDYFDNRLVGRLFFRLIGLKHIYKLFY